MEAVPHNNEDNNPPNLKAFSYDALNIGLGDIGKKALQALIAYSSYDKATTKACGLDDYILGRRRLTVLFYKTKEEREADMNDRGHAIYPSEPLLRMQKTEKDVRNL
ncbi:hypothetical protein KSP39_PZI001558 [Platanthera zijinensis]|uniref:Uncharacterized protein n=1 Tax=Platanthera zijinensis TaxID=2320716 RepID=A0AAP0C530_9ASPA